MASFPLRPRTEIKSEPHLREIIIPSLIKKPVVAVSPQTVALTTALSSIPTRIDLVSPSSSKLLLIHAHIANTILTLQGKSSNQSILYQRAMSDLSPDEIELTITMLSNKGYTTDFNKHNKVLTVK